MSKGNSTRAYPTVMRSKGSWYVASLCCQVLHGGRLSPCSEEQGLGFARHWQTAKTINPKRERLMKHRYRGCILQYLTLKGPSSAVGTGAMSMDLSWRMQHISATPKAIDKGSYEFRLAYIVYVDKIYVQQPLYRRSLLSGSVRSQL